VDVVYDIYGYGLDYYYLYMAAFSMCVTALISQ
jgi:hypothetical protein